MEILCPACAKENAVLSREAVCRRCGTELGDLFRVHLAARGLLVQAANELREGRWEPALERAAQSWSLARQPAAARVAALAAAALARSEDFARWRALA